MILQMFRTNSGTGAEAEDLYQEGILDLLEKVWNGQLVLTCKLKNFLYSICRLKWLHHLRGKTRFTDIVAYIELGGEFACAAEETAEPLDAQITRSVHALGEPCRTLLFGFYYENLSFEQLASKLGYSSMFVARQQKFRCKDRTHEEKGWFDLPVNHSRLRDTTSFFRVISSFFSVTAPFFRTRLTS